MVNTKETKGSCLCQSVKIKAKTMSLNVGACHCNMCRKWTGGVFLAVECGSEVSFEGEDNISVFNSSQWADRGFCSKCGTNLYYRIKHNNQYIIPAGLFEHDDGEFNFDHQVFIDEKPPYYSFSNKTLNMTAAEVFAKYAPNSEST